MIAEVLGKTSISEIFILFDVALIEENQQQQTPKISKSLQDFFNQYKKENGQFSFESFGIPNKMKIFLNEVISQGRSKQNISEIIEKYSKNKQLQSSGIFQSNCQREPSLCLVVFSKDNFESLEKLIYMGNQFKEEDCKTIFILEEVKEIIFAQEYFQNSQQEFDQFALNLQLQRNIDIIHTKSPQQTVNEIISCLLSCLQNRRKKNKIPCLFRERAEQNISKSEQMGVTNTYSLNWLLMLTQIPGISEAKARAIVLRYPTIKSLLIAYQNTDIEQRPYLLSEIEVIQGIVQQTSKKLGNKISEQLYTIFSTRDPEQKLLD